MLLRLLAQKMPYIVFKGGTSLSKCHKVIRRFSEDIDITIDTMLSQGQKKKIKQAIVDSSEKLGMMIENLDETRSRRDYNRYVIAYDSVIPMASDTQNAGSQRNEHCAKNSFPNSLFHGKVLSVMCCILSVALTVRSRHCQNHPNQSRLN